MIEFIWDVHQQAQIQEAKADAALAKNEASGQVARIRELEYSVQRLALASQAMWEILRTRVGITETELLDKINEIDLRDGRQDGRMSPRVTDCPKCSRKLSTKNARCIYCGTAVTKPHTFQ
jgi:hypothetical protein